MPQLPPHSVFLALAGFVFCGSVTLYQLTPSPLSANTQDAVTIGPAESVHGSRNIDFSIVDLPESSHRPMNGSQTRALGDVSMPAVSLRAPTSVAQAPAPRRKSPSQNRADTVYAMGGADLPRTTSINVAGNKKGLQGGGLALSQSKDLIVPTGARLPAAFAASESGITNAQVRVLDTLAAQFIDQTREPAGDSITKPSSSENGSAIVDPAADQVDPATWQAALDVADARYRLIFGDAAYMEKSMAEAKVALAEIQGR